MKNVTIRDIANELGISIATVSRVLNDSGYASKEVKEQVFSMAEKLRYQPNAVARSLKNHRTNTIGIIIPDISNPYFMTISKGIEDSVREYGYHLIFMSGNENPVKEKKMLQVLIEKRVDALVLATSGKNEDVIRNIKESGVPIVLIDRKLREDSLGLDLVVEDNIKGAYDLTNYLLERGHHRIGVINGSLEVSTGFERYEGFRKAIHEKGLEANPELIFNGNFTKEDGINAVDYFLNLQNKPSAILSFNNTMAFGAIIQLTKNGYSVPHDMVVASFGEVEAAQILKPSSIITIKQSPYEMGLRAGEILLEHLLDNAKELGKTIFDPHLSISE
ncbi:transcriptional regulator, LacI family [Lentibacillus halodurans]|uniref:Transcriptional regulator, LacI family n=1 Tax=Lentibacillus halodurans TaxID=237679 RepID=A0A1I0YHX1_9BACI|nr:LacI family DNA-binding transcriptional regulator [Lentibacillus halodurans]SFB11763.1 transcriptional regulator, LacI family [Lentibacillus halodurans]